MGLARARPGLAHLRGAGGRPDDRRRALSILLVTRSDDNSSVELVASALIARGLTPVRLDTDRYPLTVRVSTSCGAGTSCRRLKVGDQIFDLQEVTAVWYRRFLAGGALPAELGDTREACVHESRRTLYGTIAALDCFQLDPLLCVRKADHKELQLRKACEFGLDVPRTLFTNDAEEALAFHRELDGRVVTKMQSSFAIVRGGEEQVVFTNRVTEAHLRELSGLRYAPMIFQEWLPKRLDVRATVVGRGVFAAALDSQRQPRTRIDWRRDGLGTLGEWEPFELPPGAQRGLLALTEEFGLNYAAADFVVTPEDRLAFLEINAGGEWFWLARHPGLPIPEALAQVLTDPAARVCAWPWMRPPGSGPL